MSSQVINLTENDSPVSGDWIYSQLNAGGSGTDRKISFGTFQRLSLISGTVQSGFIGNNAVTSGNIASGQIGLFQLASGLGTGSGVLNINSIPLNAITYDSDALSITFNVGDRNKHFVTFLSGGNRTLAVTGDSSGQGFSVILKQSSVGGNSGIWWNGIHWQNGTPVVLSSGPNYIDIASFIKLGSGNYLGMGATSFF